MVRKIKDGKLKMTTTYHAKPIYSRKELYETLPLQVKNQLGGYFNKEELIRTDKDFQRLAHEFYRRVKEESEVEVGSEDESKEIKGLPMMRDEEIEELEEIEEMGRWKRSKMWKIWRICKRWKG